MGVSGGSEAATASGTFSLTETGAGFGTGTSGTGFSATATSYFLEIKFYIRCPVVSLILVADCATKSVLDYGYF